MEDSTKKKIKIGGIVGICLGTVAIYFGGGSEGYALEIVGGVFATIGLMAGLIKNA